MSRKLGGYQHAVIGVRSCFMPGLPTHLVQEFNVSTVVCKSTN